LKGRRVTLECKETSFWEVLDRLCVETKLSEAVSIPYSEPTRDMIVARAFPPALPVPIGGPVPVFPAGPGAPGNIGRATTSGQIALVEGQTAATPTVHAGAARIRVLPSPRTAGLAHSIDLNLCVALEPKVRSVGTLSLRIDSAADEHGRQLDAVIDEPIAPMVPIGRRSYVAPIAGAQYHHLHAKFQTGEKAGHTFREIRGTIAGRLYTEPTIGIVVQDVLQSSGKSYKGKYGGTIKFTAAKMDEKGNATLQLNLEPPPDSIGPVIPVVGRFRGAAPAPSNADRDMPVKSIDADQMKVGAALPASYLSRSSTPTDPGLIVLDDKGEVLRPVSVVAQSFSGPGNLIRGYTLSFRPEKDRRVSELIYAASRLAPVEIPFVLRDITIP
jgi:hypothetical protein